MKNKANQADPLLIHNLKMMMRYPKAFTNSHRDIFIGTLRMIFDKFPEIEEYLNSHEVDENDQVFFVHKLEDLKAIAKGDIAWEKITKI